MIGNAYYKIYYVLRGLARFATVQYERPNADNVDVSFMHLTNYSINKLSSDFKHGTESGDQNGSKRKLSQVFQQISEKFNIEINDLWEKVSIISGSEFH